MNINIKNINECIFNAEINMKSPLDNDDYSDFILGQIHVHKHNSIKTKMIHD